MQVKLRLRVNGPEGLLLALVGGGPFRLRYRPRQTARRTLRVRVATASLRAAAAMAMAAFLLAPLAWTLLSVSSPGPEPGFAHLLPSFSRTDGSTLAMEADYAPSGTESPEPIAVATEDAQTGLSHAAGASGQPAPGRESAQVAPTAGPVSGASTASPARRPVDRALQSRYLRRAWTDSGQDFHGRSQPFVTRLVYRPDEGYRVVAAAYRAPSAYRPAVRRQGQQQSEAIRAEDDPLEEPQVDPRYAGDPEDPYGFPERRTPAAVPSEGGSSSRGRSFQPWDGHVFADPFGPANDALSGIPGLRLDNVVVFQGYSSNGYPLNSGFRSVLDGRIGSDIDVGAMATLSWSRPGPTSSLNLTYTPSYISRLRFSEWNSLDHRLGLSASKQFARWDLNFYSGAALQGLAEVLFQPPVFRSVENAPRTFDDLVDSTAGGDLNSEEVASVLTGAPVVEKQGETDYGLGRVFSARVGTGANYSHSPRMNIHFGLSGGHYQAVSVPEADDTTLALLGLRRSTSVAGNAGMTYRVNPGTEVGVEGSLRQNLSTHLDAVYATTSGTVRQRLGRRWLASGSAGASRIYGLNALRFASDQPEGSSMTWVARGELQYSGRAHGFSVGVGRSAGDPVGLGSRVSYNASANWSWAPIGSRWAFYSGANWYQFSSRDAFNRNTEGTTYGGGVVRRLSPQTSVSAGYTYQSFNSPFRGIVSNLDRHRVQVQWMWRPAGERR